MRPYSQACENNKGPILDVLASYLGNKQHVLEIGSGTGQHAVFFAPRFPHLVWQTSDVLENHAGIIEWLDYANEPNLKYPLQLDVTQSDHWEVNNLHEQDQIDAVFSANTAHIMPWEAVVAMFENVGKLLKSEGIFVLYGPFNRDGEFTSESNRMFDRSLRQRFDHMGIRDDAEILRIATNSTLNLVEDIAMPANNRCLVFKRSRSSA